ncbi:DUF2809 domain-containing protein [bacterium]|nr:MAG: DUF2809 domain-containing protein [bacterium]
MLHGSDAGTSPRLRDARRRRRATLLLPHAPRRGFAPAGGDPGRSAGREGVRPTPDGRPRLQVASMLIATILAGLASRAIPALPAFVVDHAGDALWAVALYWALAFLLPAASVRTLAAAALLGAFAVEFAQLLHWPWLDAIRRHRVGHLLLGSDFVWIDLLRYAVGVALAAAIDRSLWRGARL